MDNIGNFIEIKTSVEKGLVLINIRLLDAEITKLRALKMADQMRKLFNDLHDDRIKTFVMSFDISNLQIVQKEYIEDVIELILAVACVILVEKLPLSAFKASIDDVIPAILEVA